MAAFICLAIDMASVPIIEGAGRHAIYETACLVAGNVLICGLIWSLYATDKKHY